MHIDRTIEILKYMFYGQSALGSYGMMASAHSGYLLGIVSVFILTLICGVYLVYLTQSCMEIKAKMNGTNFDYVGINTHTKNGHTITVRGFTNEPHKFNSSLPNDRKAHTLHKALDFSKS